VTAAQSIRHNTQVSNIAILLQNTTTTTTTTTSTNINNNINIIIILLLCST